MPVTGGKVGGANLQWTMTGPLQGGACSHAFSTSCTSSSRGGALSGVFWSGQEVYQYCLRLRSSPSHCHIDMYMVTHIHTHTDAHKHAFIHRHTQACIHSQTHKHAHTQMHTSMHAHTRTCMHAHTDTHMNNHSKHRHREVETCEKSPLVHKVEVILILTVSSLTSAALLQWALLSRQLTPSESAKECCTVREEHICYTVYFLFP